MKKTVVIIGGGASGFFSAVNLAHQKGIKVIIVEKTNKILSKVKVSGGGRCNVTFNGHSIEEVAHQYPRGEKFLKKILHHFFVTDTINWFTKRGVPLRAEPDGRIFPVSNSSQSIIDCFLKEANRYNIDIQMNREVESVTVIDETFEVNLRTNEKIKAHYVIVACGGYPKNGMYHWIEKLNHKITQPVPSLYTFNLPKHAITQLMGLSVPEVQVKIKGTKFSEQAPILITHWGLSGPAIIKLSAWAALYLAEKNWQFEIQINWVPNFNEESIKLKFYEFRQTLASLKVSAKNQFLLPARLWDFLLIESSIPTDTRWADLTSKSQNNLIKNICNYTLNINGKTTYKEEFVTAGGINLNEINPNTMMSKVVPNLYFTGEILNIDGITGGFNFQNAWTTGFIAAKSILSHIE